MEDYNKIIESLNVRFLKGRNITMLQPLTITNFYEVENAIFLLHDGDISLTFGDGATIKARRGDVLFIPAGKQACISYGADGTKLNNETFSVHRDDYFKANFVPDNVGEGRNSFSYITFEAKIFDFVNFFQSLDIEPFIIPQNKQLLRLLTDVVVENIDEKPIGKEKMIRLKTEQIVIEIIRYLLNQKIFIEQLANNIAYFKDPRLIEIFNYIKVYIGGDLSNKVLASVADVSEDYVGQYFKLLTGINPQDYIEYQRMEKAVELLRTSKKSIKDIGNDIGYKDTAYFCRRFKMMFGISAGKMRKRETLMNI